MEWSTGGRGAFPYPTKFYHIQNKVNSKFAEIRKFPENLIKATKPRSSNFSPNFRWCWSEAAKWATEGDLTHWPPSGNSEKKGGREPVKGFPNSKVLIWLGSFEQLWNLSFVNPFVTQAWTGARTHPELIIKEARGYRALPQKSHLTSQLKFGMKNSS